MSMSAHTGLLAGNAARTTPASAPIAAQTTAALAAGHQVSQDRHGDQGAQEAPHAAYIAPPRAAANGGSPQRLTPGKHSYGYAVASFVLGIASIVSGWTLIGPIVGVTLGAIALRRNTSERTLALWGLWLNIAMLAAAAVGVAVLIALSSVGLLTGALAVIAG